MTHTKMIKIVIADDHPGIRASIRNLLEHCPEFFIVGEAENGLQALQLVRELGPDVLLLDIHMPVMDGIEVLEILRKTDDRIRILILSAFANQFFLFETITRGANGYIIKEDAPTLLEKAINNCVYIDKLTISPKILPPNKTLEMYAGRRGGDYFEDRI
jgi:DNA-binding NarL/FixJ family response regulator